MLNSEVVEKLISQLNFEFYSSYMYLDISNYFSDENLDGFANWFMIQTQEERDHAAEAYSDGVPDDRELRRRCRQLRDAGRDLPACR